MLTQHPSYQTQLRAEIRSAFPDGYPDTISYEQLEALKLLNLITEEVIRLYPPVALTMREANRDTTLDGHFVPKGTTLVVVPWALQRNPEVWGADADEFRPERWEDDLLAGGKGINILTFLAGPRNCIGMGFARMEFKALLVALVGRLEFEAPLGRTFEIQGGLTSKPRGGMKVDVKVVGGW